MGHLHLSVALHAGMLDGRTPRSSCAASAWSWARSRRCLQRWTACRTLWPCCRCVTAAVQLQVNLVALATNTK